MELIDRFYGEFKPHNLDAYGGEHVHGISLAKALSFPPKMKTTKELFDWIESHDSFHNIFCCHALYKFGTYFDWAFLLVHSAKVKKEFLLRKYFNKLESTIDYYKTLQKEGKISVDNFKLDVLCNTFKIDLKHHDAESDMEACRDLYIKGREL